jgi:hypothetical protein
MKPKSLKVITGILLATLGWSSVLAAPRTTPYSKLPEAIRYDIRTELGDTWDVKKGEFGVRYIDLNKDGTLEIIVEGANAGAGCGNHSCFIAIYQKVSGGGAIGYQRLLQGTGFGFGIGPGRTKGYLDVHEEYTFSAFRHIKVTSKWDGKEYKMAKCLDGMRDSESENDKHDNYVYKSCGE